MPSDPNKFRRMMFALDADKQKGLNSINPNTSMSAPPLTVSPKIPLMATHTITPPIIHPPINTPSLPGLNKLPHFGKMKNSLKSQIKPLK